jgi:serine/threonine protein kinase
MENYLLPEGFILREKYSIVKVLGQGGFGITYLAEDIILGTRFCIKELFISGSSTRGQNMTVLTHNLKDFSFADFKERFLLEAKQLAKFSHMNIVRVIDFFEANNTAYVVMEYLKGQTLKELVASKGPLSFQESNNIIAQLLTAVEIVHNAGMLHRDIKPDNIILTNDGRVVLIDFGSARAFTEGKTVAQTAMVSPGYAPLEQYNPNARKGSYTDIYSIGATFYFMLTGHKPLNVTERYSERMLAPHELNKLISIQISSAVMLAMEMKAEDRFQNVNEFREAVYMLSGQKTKIVKENRASSNEDLSLNKVVENRKSNTNFSKALAIILILSIITCLVIYLKNAFDLKYKPMESEDIHIKISRVYASSVLPDTYGYNFLPDNVIDGALSTFWSPNKAVGNPWIKLDFDKNCKINGFKIHAGSHNKNYKHEGYYTDLYYLNYRVRQLKVVFSDASSELFLLSDVDEIQTIKFDKSKNTSSITFYLLDKYDRNQNNGAVRWSDYCISEIEILN